jgi:hypothetical protein
VCVSSRLGFSTKRNGRSTILPFLRLGVPFFSSRAFLFNQFTSSVFVMLFCFVYKSGRYELIVIKS